MLTVADRIKQIREDLDMTQTDLAIALGLSDKSSVSKIEKSGNDITLKNVERIAKVLNVTPSYLMGWEEADSALMAQYNSASADVLNSIYGHFGYSSYLLVCAYEDFLPKEGKEELISFLKYLSHKYDIADKLPTEKEAMDLFEANNGIDI